MRSIQRCAFAALLLSVVAAPLARADEADPKVREKFCQANPERCQEVKKRREARCKEHGEDCAAMEAKRAARQAECEAHPESCKKKPALPPKPATPIAPAPPAAEPGAPPGDTNSPNTKRPGFDNGSGV